MLTLRDCNTGEVFETEVDYPGDNTVIYVPRIGIAGIVEADVFDNRPLQIGWHIMNEEGVFEILKVTDEG